MYKLSFSHIIKEEICSHPVESRHCLIAELLAYINLCGEFSEKKDLLMFRSENSFVLGRIAAILGEAYSSECNINGNVLSVNDEEVCRDILSSTKAKSRLDINTESLIDPLVVSNVCCKRAYITASFLCSGSVSDPDKYYHLEIVNPQYEHAKELKRLVAQFSVEMKMIERKGHYVLYLKEGELIVDMLNIIGAHRSLMEIENLRILKEMRNNVNRIVNCETANINKVVSAAVRQIEAIKYIEKRGMLNTLPIQLLEIARLRLDNEQASLKELGEMLSVPIGKSGVNHRLNKICKMADELKGV